MLAKLKGGTRQSRIAAFISCLLMMVQGDVTAIDVPHWIARGDETVDMPQALAFF